MTQPLEMTMEQTHTGSPKDLDDTKALFDRMGVKYTITADVGKLMVSFDRNEWDSKTQALTKINPKYVDHDTRLEMDQGPGHAAMALFFKDGYFVHQCGYET